MHQTRTRKQLPIALALATGFASAPALAQLEEVLVTAQKRVESLQDTPIAITAFDASDIDARGISNVGDLALIAPNVQIAETPAGTSGATIAIRGASTLNPAVTWEPVVGLYMDGVFLGKNLGGIFEVAELERIEVLRGPQGTLYGKNTVGGAINLITRMPGESFGGRVDLSVGSDGYQKGRLRLDTGTLGAFRASLSYSSAQRDGFYDNVNNDPTGGFNPFWNPRSSKEFNDLDSEVWRIDTVFDATENLSFRYAYDNSKREQEPSKGQLTDVSQFAFEQQDLGFLGQLLSLYDTPDDKNVDSISNDFAMYERSEIDGHSFFIDWQLGDITLKSITAQRDMKYSDLLDIDGSPMDLFHSGRDIDYQQFSQEFQLLGSGDNFNYVVGLYYFEEDADVINPITFFGLFGSPTDRNEYGMDNDSSAIYGQADWTPAALDRLTVTLGLRYTEESKDQYIVHPNSSTGGAGAFDEQGSEDWDNTSGTFIAAWALSDDINIYGKVSQGWKSGGFNGEAPTAETFQTPYDAEEVLAYEIGMKSRFLEQRLQVNLAGFYNDISDMQFSVFLEGSGGAASTVDNAGEATFRGLEAEIAYLVTDSLLLSLNYGYLDTQYDKFIEGGQNVAAFKDVAYAPEHTASLALDWGLAQWDWGALDLHVDWNYNDGYYPWTNPDQNATSEVKDHQVINASLILSEVPLGSDRTMQFGLWGKNIADEEYRQNTIPFGFWTISYFAAPASYGFDARVNF